MARIGWQGVFPAATAPFKDDFSLDIPAMQRGIEALIRGGVSGRVDPTTTKPRLNVFDIPLAGAALEVSPYNWWGTVTAFNSPVVLTSAASQTQ